MAFISILFGEDEFNVQPEPQVPSCFRDLNLDQVVNAVVTGRQTYDLKPFFYTPLRRVDAILFRHAIWRDLEDQELLEGLRAFAQRMVVMHRYLNLAHKLAYPIHRQGWFLEAAVSYCEAVAALNRDLARADVRSRGLLAFRASLRDYEDSADFGAWRDDATRLQSILSSLAYCIHIKGRTVQVSKYAQEADYSAEITQTFAKFKQGDVKDYRTTLRAASGMDHVQAQILDRVARLYPDAFAALDQFCSSRATFCDPGLLRFEREIQFYIAYLDFIGGLRRMGLPFCYPEITREKDVYAREAFDIALANQLVGGKEPVVRNDFSLNGPERILVVSGPNQGGKTTFARMFGQMHHLASLGLPVPGLSARLLLTDQILTHFEREEDIQDQRGKLEDDLVRIHAALGQATSESLFVINEMLSSTSLADALVLGARIMEQIIARDCLCVWVTFVDELSALNEATVSMVSTVAPHDPTLRTFKVVRHPADGLAYALAIAKKRGVTYQQILERVSS